LIAKPRRKLPGSHLYKKRKVLKAIKVRIYCHLNNQKVKKKDHLLRMPRLRNGSTKIGQSFHLLILREEVVTNKEGLFFQLMILKSSMKSAEAVFRDVLVTT
jgi:hypothetical protein